MGINNRYKKLLPVALSALLHSSLLTTLVGCSKAGAPKAPDAAATAGLESIAKKVIDAQPEKTLEEKVDQSVDQVATQVEGVETPSADLTDDSEADSIEALAERIEAANGSVVSVDTEAEAGEASEVLPTSLNEGFVEAPLGSGREVGGVKIKAAVIDDEAAFDILVPKDLEATEIALTEISVTEAKFVVAESVDTIKVRALNSQGEEISSFDIPQRELAAIQPDHPSGAVDSVMAPNQRIFELVLNQSEMPEVAGGSSLAGVTRVEVTTFAGQVQNGSIVLATRPIANRSNANAVAADVGPNLMGGAAPPVVSAGPANSSVPQKVGTEKPAQPKHSVAPGLATAIEAQSGLKNSGHSGAGVPASGISTALGAQLRSGR